jgi:hypothetical protein
MSLHVSVDKFFAFSYIKLSNRKGSLERGSWGMRMIGTYYHMFSSKFYFRHLTFNFNTIRKLTWEMKSLGQYVSIFLDSNWWERTGTWRENPCSKGILNASTVWYYNWLIFLSFSIIHFVSIRQEVPVVVTLVAERGLRSTFGFVVVVRHYFYYITMVVLRTQKVILFVVVDL